MDTVSFLRFLGAFGLILAMIGLMYLALKRWPALRGMGTASGAGRLKIVEQRPIDARRKLVLVQRDDVQHLLLLSASGEQVVETGIVPPQGGADAR